MRLLRALARALVLTIILLVGAGTAAAAATQTAWFREWLRGVIVKQSAEFLNGTLAIGHLRGNLFSGLNLSDVSVSVDGQTVISLQDVALRYNAWQLVTRGLAIDELKISNPTIALRRADDGWQLARLLKRQEQEADRQGPSRPFRVERIVVAGGVAEVDGGDGIPHRVDGLSLVASFAYEPVRYSFELESLTVRTVDPDLHVRLLSGDVAVRDDTVFINRLSLKTDETTLTLDGAVQRYQTTPILNLRVSAPAVSVPEIGRFVPSLAGIDLRPSLDATVEGALNGLKIQAVSTSSAGSLRASLAADFAEPGYSVGGDVSLRHLDLAPIVNDAASKSDIAADGKVDAAVSSLSDLSTLRGSVTANARVAIAGYVADRIDLRADLAGREAHVDARLFAYRARATARGSVSLPTGAAPVRYDLRGQVQHLNLRNVPSAAGAPPVSTEINARYHVVGVQPMAPADRGGRRLTADLSFAPTVLPGVQIVDGSTVQAHVIGQSLAYRTDIGVRRLDLLQLGHAFEVEALKNPRYRSVIEARVVASGAGTEPATMDMDARATIASAEILGGQINNLQMTGALHHDEATVDAVGAFAGFDPAALSGKPLAAGRLDGELSGRGRLSSVSAGLAPDRIAGDVRATLAQSVVGGLTIEAASLDAGYDAQVAIIRDLTVTGRDANVKASGSLAIADTGESDLRVHADSPSLAEIGRLFDVPLLGIARIDATVTGNRGELRANGTLEGDGLRYQTNGALALRTSFTATVPHLSFADATLDADSRATFATIAGQNINELTARTRYETAQVGFELTAKQPMRQLDAAGALTIHPDHQEIHLDRLALQAGNQQWTVPEGVRPTINYGGTVVAIEQLRLVSGDQTLVADGAFGNPGERLEVRATNVDLAAVDALLLRPPQFSGRLDATVRVDGTLQDPHVAADFTVNAGGFRQFSYESLTGQAEYSGPTLSLDARLQQNPTQWITAKGKLPTALWQGDAASDESRTIGPDHDAQAPDDERVDLVIDSSPLGLGLLQGFTTALTNVDGTVEAHVRLTGSARDPHPEGTITIADGTMSVVPTGVTYTNIAGKVELQPDRVHIDSLVALDNHQSAISLTGNLAVHAREVGGVQLFVNAEDFKVIDNEIGNVRIQTALEISGELRAPVIAGDFSVDTGRVDLDTLLALAAPSPYSTKPLDIATPPPDGEPTPVDATPKETSIFDALRMDLRVQVPDDLIVKASNLQAPGASVGLGALNVTLGGDLVATKAPRESVRLTGTVNTVRGTYQFQGRRFDILRDGTIRFDGGERITPILEIRTRREIQGVEALVTVRGTIERPEIVLASTPPLEQADILSLIVFNQPINQLGEGQQVSLSARAQSLAVGAVAGQLSQSIGNALNLDTFEIDLGPDNGAAAEVTLGQQLGKDLYLRVQQGVGEMTSTNVIIEYAFSQWLRLQTNVLQGSSSQQSLFRRQQGSGADLIVLFTK